MKDADAEMDSKIDKIYNKIDKLTDALLQFMAKEK